MYEVDLWMLENKESHFILINNHLFYYLIYYLNTLLNLHFLIPSYLLSTCKNYSFIFFIILFIPVLQKNDSSPSVFVHLFRCLAKKKFFK